ncbi:hypothetical protein Nepgr_003016 [Nepenthes gracilis]|uniref:Uncharacterized protein n=1 Tax=Nepenthes gracilis TaxID=150966 RepID=A0AAD3RYR5_NEPGR|nr:hypothetical protein Nepgr_003016 [Nepenthes gracilis]
MRVAGLETLMKPVLSVKAVYQLSSSGDAIVAAAESPLLLLVVCRIGAAIVGGRIFRADLVSRWVSWRKDACCDWPQARQQADTAG